MTFEALRDQIVWIGRRYRLGHLPGAPWLSAYLQRHHAELSRVAADQGLMWVTVDETALLVDPAVHFGDVLASGQVYEPQIRRLLRELLQPGDTVVEVGAHWGYHTLLMAKLVGEAGRVYAFEPFSSNYEMLRMSIDASDATTVVLSRQAIGEATRRASIALAEQTNSGSASLRALPPASNGAIAEMVDVITLDDFLRGNEVRRVALLKVDAEGAETLVLSGVTEHASAIDSLLIELHPHYLTDADYRLLLDSLSHRLLEDVGSWGTRFRVRTLADLRRARCILATKPAQTGTERGARRDGRGR
jgi:FkbM family methyltransferase